MPIFEYTCRSCGTVSEILTGVGSDETKAACAQCGGTDLKKKFSVMSFTVKGSSTRVSSEQLPCGAESREACPHCSHVE